MVFATFGYYGEIRGRIRMGLKIEGWILKASQQLAALEIHEEKGKCRLSLKELLLLKGKVEEIIT